MELKPVNESKSNHWRKIVKDFKNDCQSINVTEFVEYLRNSDRKNKICEKLSKNLHKETDENGMVEFEKFINILETSDENACPFRYCVGKYFEFVKFIIPAEKKICKKIKNLAHIHHMEHGENIPLQLRKISNKEDNEAVNVDDNVSIITEHRNKSKRVLLERSTSPESSHTIPEEIICKDNRPTMYCMAVSADLLPQFSDTTDNSIKHEDDAKSLEELPAQSPPNRAKFTYFKQISMYSASEASYEDEYTCKPPPLFIFTISLAQVVLYCIDQGLGYPANATGPVATVMVYNPNKQKEAWRYFTYMFVHIGKFHLIVNLIVQLVLGLPLESVNKWFRVMLVYLSGVVAGSLGTFITDPTSLLSGASGGVYSLITAHVASIIMNWSDMSYPLVHLSVFAILIICDVGSCFHDRFILEIKDNIGVTAHVCGAVAGLLVGITVLRNIVVKKYEKIIQLISVIFFSTLIVGAIICNIFNLTF